MDLNIPIKARLALMVQPLLLICILKLRHTLQQFLVAEEEG